MPADPHGPHRPDSEQILPASDAQLLRLGRLLGLRLHEAEALLEVLEDLAEKNIDKLVGPMPMMPKTEDVAAPGRFHDLLALLPQLRCVPGLFLFTDGVTPSRLERAVARVMGVGDASARIREVLHRAESAAHKEARLLHRVARTLLSGVRSGRIPLGPR